MIPEEWEKIYQAGESNQLADWVLALSDILPDYVEVQPSQVEGYIVGLQREVDRLRGDLEDAKRRLGWKNIQRILDGTYQRNGQWS